jgi:hypothetical protein
MLSPLNGRRKGILERIANLVMKERSFLPDFSRAALSELENMRQVDGGADLPRKDRRQLFETTRR